MNRRDLLKGLALSILIPGALIPGVEFPSIYLDYMNHKVNKREGTITTTISGYWQYTNGTQVPFECRDVGRYYEPE